MGRPIKEEYGDGGFDPVHDDYGVEHQDTGKDELNPVEKRKPNMA